MEALNDLREGLWQVSSSENRLASLKYKGMPAGCRCGKRVSSKARP